MSKNVTLVHPFKDILLDVDEFLKADNNVGITNTIEGFCDKIKKLSDKYSDTIRPEDFKGWAFELFAEYFVKTNAADNRVGIYNYTPVDSADDYGVDGHGFGDNQFPATVQVKFRSGDYVLTANEDHLVNFQNCSCRTYGVRMEDTKNMLIITTAKKVDERTMEKMLFNSVRVLNRDALRHMLDNRPEWWIGFYDAIKFSRIEKSNVPPPKMDLRLHQMEAVKAVSDMSANIGKVILPTGTGKTLVEAEIIQKTIVDIQSKNDLSKVPVIKVNSPRILLCFQLFKDISTYLNSYGISAVYVNYNSGNVDSQFWAKLVRKYGGIYNVRSTTSIQELQDAYANAKVLKLPLIVVSTYHSAEKFSESGIVPDLTIHDEAHNLVSREFQAVAKIPSGRSLFFTATERVDGPENNIGLGMNNALIFGETIYSKSPKEMIEAGEMVPPYIHVVRARKGKKVDLDKIGEDPKALVKSIVDAFIAHQKALTETSVDDSNIGAKVLVVCRGQQDLEDMLKKHAENAGENVTVFGRFRQKYPNIHVFALSSDFGVYIDGDYYDSIVTHAKKYELLKRLQSLSPSDQAIIFHVDMIGEGIDVPGITGVMPFRNNDDVKFVQNIGRASRLHPIDRKKVYAGELTVTDRSKWIKPRSWVIVPTFLENSDGFLARFRRIVQKMREEYGWTKDNVIIDNVEGLSDEDEIDTVNDISKNRPHSNAGPVDFDHEFENFNSIEQVIFDDKVQLEYEKAKSELEALIALA